MDLVALVTSMPFAVATGVEIDAAAAELVRGRLAWAPERCTTGGLLHGGAVMTLADSVGAVCAFLNLPEGASTSTIESKTNFFRGVRDGEIVATAQPLHVGRTTIVVQTDVRTADDKRVALVTQTSRHPRASSPDDHNVAIDRITVGNGALQNTKPSPISSPALDDAQWHAPTLRRVRGARRRRARHRPRRASPRV
jgi:uncharacterized protein (TIGR00369 family)